DSLPEVLHELREALEHNGFTAAEAERIIIPVMQGALPLGTHPRTVQFEPGAEIDAGVAAVQAAALAGKAEVDAAKGTVTVMAPLSEDDLQKLMSCVRTPEAKAKVREINTLVRETEMAFGGSGK